MNDSRDYPEMPERTPLMPSAVGRGLPVPPLVPLVAVACLLAGLAIGYRIAPNYEASPQSPTPSAPEITVSPSEVYAIWPAIGPVTFPPTLPTASLPADGLSMKNALSALESLGWGLPPSTIVSLRVDLMGNVGLDTGLSPDEWVWVFVIGGDSNGSVMCGPVGPETTADPSASPSALVIQTDGQPEPVDCQPMAMEMTVILDYRTGDLIETYGTVTGN